METAAALTSKPFFIFPGNTKGASHEGGKEQEPNKAEALEAYILGRWPQVFDWGNPRPLKIGIREDLEAALPAEFKVSKSDAARLSGFLKQYTKNCRYARAIMRGGCRVGLDGQPTDAISIETREHGAQRLGARIEYLKEKRREEKRREREERERAAREREREERRRATKGRKRARYEANLRARAEAGDADAQAKRDATAAQRERQRQLRERERERERQGTPRPIMPRQRAPSPQQPSDDDERARANAAGRALWDQYQRRNEEPQTEAPAAAQTQTKVRVEYRKRRGFAAS